MNDLSITVYDGTTVISDNDNSLSRAEELAFDRYYPGGLDGACTFFLPRDPTKFLPFKPGFRVVIRDGLTPVWEGKIVAVSPSIDQARMGQRITCAGWWELVMTRRHLNRRYIDNRITDDIWTWDTAASAAEKCTVNREARLRFQPYNVQWTSAQYAQVVYKMPIDEYVYEVSGDYDLQEGSQAWRLDVYHSSNGSAWTLDYTIATATGTGSFSRTVGGSPYRWISLRFTNDSGGNQTPAGDGTEYGEISNVRVLARTANTGNTASRLEEIAVDMIEAIDDLNDDAQNIDSPAGPLALEGFVTNDYEILADILFNACQVSTNSTSRWISYLKNSYTAATPTGKPVLFVEQTQLLSDYDYIVAIGDRNLVNPLEFDQSLQETSNYIIVRYQDENGRTQFSTPADNASLKDTISISTYGQREYVLDVGERDAINAEYAGIAYLAEYKDPRWTLTTPVIVQEYILKKNGLKLPACQIMPGMRLKIGNYFDDGSSTWLTFRIIQVTYDDASRTAMITTGIPEGPHIPAFSWPELPPSEVAKSGGAQGLEKDTPGGKPNWKKRLGIPAAKWRGMSWAEKKRRIDEYRKHKR